MRLWTLHPKYLDPPGLTGLWREALLAQRVLRGETESYRNHPQMDRFEAQPDPVACIGSYLEGIYRESLRRNYSFNAELVGPERTDHRIETTAGQLEYEWQHLLGKLERRAEDRYEELVDLENPEAHPLFEIVPGDIEPWERV